MAYQTLLVMAPAKAAALAPALEGGAGVSTAALARAALDSLRAKVPDLVVVEEDLPDLPGPSLLQILRGTPEWKDLPIIYLVRAKTEESVRRAFALGVDDYMAEPVDPREFAARARVVLRRRFERLETLGGPLAVGGIEIDPGQRLCLAHGKRVRLRPREFELLEILMRKAGRVLTRTYLLEAVWGMSREADTRAVDVMVSRLRRSLGARAARQIETVSKLGYCLLA